jgi:hypothetical protein
MTLTTSLQNIGSYLLQILKSLLVLKAQHAQS